MKKLFNRLILVLCIISLAVPSIAFASPSTNYTLTGNQADDVLAVAAAQIGKNGKEMGFNDQWCAFFVSWA